MIKIGNIDKAELLIELFNNSYQQGPGVLCEDGKLSYEEAEEILSREERISYIYGRPIMVDLSGDSFDPSKYDICVCTENNRLKAEEIVSKLRGESNYTKSELETIGSSNNGVTK